jgi:pimeloyl-ACP methyl ester carboxylesterase
MGSIDLPDAHVAFAVRGHGPPVVLIHGWACRRADFGPIADDLARDHRVLALDLPWHGESTSVRLDWSVADLGALVAEVAAGEGMGDAVLVGHSMGAAVALEAALAGAGHRVVALDGLTFMHMYPRQDAEAVEGILGPMRADFPGSVRALCERAAGPSTDAALTNAVAMEMLQMDPAAGVAAMRSLLEWDMDEALHRAAHAGIGITAHAADCLLSAAAAEAYGDRFTIVPVGLGGHFYLREDPAGTAALIRAPGSG